MGHHHHAKKKHSAGKWSAVLAMVCAVHCMAVPLLAGLLPFVGLSFLESHLFEFLMIGTGVGLGAFSLTRSFSRDHRNPVPFTIFAFGAVAVLLAMFLLPHEVEHIVLPIGAGLIGIAQLVNIRYARRCETCVA